MRNPGTAMNHLQWFALLILSAAWTGDGTSAIVSSLRGGSSSRWDAV